MPKIKLTKGELKRQRDNLRQFYHYLPTLQLKKQQLQIKILEIKRILNQKLSILISLENKIDQWVGLLGDPNVTMDTSERDAKGSQKFDLKKRIYPQELVTEKFNIAGANIPVFKDVVFKDAGYDFFATPFWIDRGIQELKKFISLLLEIEIIKKQIAILERELKITTQRVNLFEKIKIPECIENVRLIRIYLGDQMANAVGISKVAKKKIEASVSLEVAA